MLVAMHVFCIGTGLVEVTCAQKISLQLIDLPIIINCHATIHTEIQLRI